MKKFLAILFFSLFCFASFSQNVLNEFWENGKLKFVQMYPRIDSVYVVDTKTGIQSLEVINGFDSIAYYSKEGNRLDYDTFVKRYSYFESYTKQEKLDYYKRVRDDSIAEAAEINRLNKLVALTKKRKIYLDESLVNMTFTTGNKDVCGKVINGIKTILGACYRPMITVYTMKDTVVKLFTIENAKATFKVKEDYVKLDITSNYPSPALKGLCSRIDNDNVLDYNLRLENVYLKDKDNNYFKINEYKNFKLICDK